MKQQQPRPPPLLALHATRQLQQPMQQPMTPKATPSLLLRFSLILCGKNSMRSWRSKCSGSRQRSSARHHCSSAF